MRLLEGQVTDDDVADSGEVFRLKEKIRELENRLSVSRMETEHAKREAARALSALRKQLSPLYRALQQVFGELDAAGIDESEEGPQSSASPRVSAVWENWKQRLGGGAAKVIDALLVHSDLNTQQLAITTGLHRTTIPKLIYQLNKAGLLNKNGGRFSLKQL